MIKKAICTSALCLMLAANTSYALSNEVKLKGVLDFQAFNLTSDGVELQKMASKKKKGFGFYSSGDVYLDYALVSESGLKYGAKVGLELTSKNDRAIPASVYLQGDIGKFEAGSDKSAGKKMRITGYTGSCGSAGAWETHVKTSPDKDKISYVTNFCSFLDSKMRIGAVEYSRKVTYFTPNFTLGENNTLQLGVSYVPDSSNMGNGDVSDATLHTPVGSSKYKFAIKDGVSYGITHKIDISDKISIKTAFVGEVGKPIAYETIKKNGSKLDVKSNVKFKRLNNYVVGSEFKYDKVALTGSYGNYNKSLSSKEIDKLGQNTYLYALGARYIWDPKISFSVNYFHSEHKKNKLDASTFGLDYKLADGLKTYFQAGYYQTNGKYFNDDSKLIIDKSHGTLVVVGAKISL